MFETGFPGHMAKAKRTMAEHIRLVDLVVEVLDARAPFSTANPELARLAGRKPRIIVLNKADLANPAVTRRWLQHLQAQGLAAVAASAVAGRGIKELVQLMRVQAEPGRQKLAAKGIRRAAARVMIVGIPNVGKSQLINRLVGKTAARTGDQPGITRGKQWVRVAGDFELLDTPGVLWPRLQNAQTVHRLALLGTIGGGEYDAVEVATVLAAHLAGTAPAALRERYRLAEIASEPSANLTAIGTNRGCLGPGGSVDIAKAAALLVRDYQTGNLGRISLELPPEGETMAVADDIEGDVE